MARSIDLDPASFVRLPDSFAGTTVKGVGFDRDTLIRAGWNAPGCSRR